MLDSHLKGNLYKKLRPMVTVIISQAQFPRVEGLGSHQYGIAVCLTPGQSSSNGMLLGRQSARTCGASSDSDGSSNLESVTWNEIFFFKADPLDDYTLEFVATDMGKGFLGALSKKQKIPNTGKGFTGDRSSGYLQISPSREGPWTTVRLNYVAHAACWPLGNAVVASEVIVEDGNRYVNIRSLVSVSNTTDIVLDLCLQLNSSNASLDTLDTLDDTSNHSSTNETNTEDVQKHIFIGELKPGESIPLPLFGLVHSGLYVLQLRPSTLNDGNEYLWSSVMDKHVLSENVNTPGQSFGINVSSLEESEELLYCSETSGTSSNKSSGMWFCLAIQASEISKDICSDPIQDWNIVVKSPLSITNYLPLAAEYSVLEMQTTGHFITSSRGIFNPGETVKVLNADIRNPLYFSLLPQRGWLPIHEAVLLSHPSLEPAKTLGLRSSVSGRVVHLVLEQNFENERPLAPKILRVYSPYWLTIARCPPLPCQDKQRRLVHQMLATILEDLHC
nr:pleckstrin homology (PH) domain-containing protein [Tanacetum cinerariifolium]